MYRRKGDDAGQAFALYGRGGVLRYLGAFAKAERDLVASLAAAPDRLARAFTLMALGGLRRMVGRHAESLENYKEALGIARPMRDEYAESYANCGVGNALRMMNRRAEARRYLDRAESGYRRIGDRVSRPYTILGIALMEIAEGRRGRVAEARRMFRATRDLRGQVHADLVEAVRDASLRDANRDAGCAARLAGRARRAAERLGLKLEVAHADYISAHIRGRKDVSAYRRLKALPPRELTELP